MRRQIYSVLDALGVRVFWGEFGRADALPWISVFVVSGSEGTTLSGRQGHGVARIQVDVCAATALAAADLAAEVQTALVGYSDGPIWHVEMDGMRDLSSRDGGEVIQRVSLDFAVQFRV